MPCGSSGVEFLGPLLDGVQNEVDGHDASSEGVDTLLHAQQFFVWEFSCFGCFEGGLEGAEALEEAVLRGCEGSQGIVILRG